MSNKNIYNKLPEGYIPLPKVDRTKELKLLRHGSITEITLDGKTFQVHDPARIEQMIKFVERHDERLFSMGQENIQLKRKIDEITIKVNSLQSTVNNLQEIIKNAGFDRF